MEWKDVTSAEAEAKKHYRPRGGLLSFYLPSVFRFLASFRSLLSIEALKRAFSDKYAIMVGLCVVQGLLYLPFLILSPQKNLLMPKAMISALWLSVAVTAIAGMLVNLSQMTIPLIAGVVSVALFPWFLRTSKRAKLPHLAASC